MTSCRAIRLTVCVFCVQVTTLFHEFGHALQHMLTTESCGPVAGINQVDWDAVELPSQFMENWCYDKKVLRKIGKHFETNEPLPDDLYEKLVASKNFGSGEFIFTSRMMGN